MLLRALIIIFFIVLASLVSLWSWGRFARTARGPTGLVLPAEAAATELDRLVQTQLDRQPPGQSAASLIADPLDAFLSRAQSARLAERSLDVQYYIWKQDRSGHLLERELLQAARRGVRVRMLLDDLPAAGNDPALLVLNAHPLIEVRLFNPTRNRARGIRRALEMGLRFIGFNRRMHNKAWIADNRLAVVGGRNIGDEYFGAADTNFYDTDLLLLGPVVEQASAIFDHFWNSAAVVPLDTLNTERRRQKLQDPTVLEAQWEVDAADSPWIKDLGERQQWLLGQVEHGGLELFWSGSYRVLSDPPEKASAIAAERDRAGWLLYDILALLFSARKQSWIVSPYFVPGESGSLLFSGQAQRNMDVRVLTNSLAANDVPLVHAGYKKYRKKLLRHGVRLYELKPGNRSTNRLLVGSGGASLHSKCIIVDGRYGYVGSFNFDPRSVQLNTEMGVLFDQIQLANAMKHRYLQSTAPQVAWHVVLSRDEHLQWQGPDGLIKEREPNTGRLLRLLVHLLGLLPLESQL